MHDNSHRAPDEFDDDINLEDEDEMAEWCRLFECSAAELRAAIKARDRAFALPSH
jgi:hypothetical protein